MDKVKIPDSLSISGWNAVKNDIAKDKALASKVQAESAKLTSALTALDKAHSAFDFGLGDPKDVTAAAAATAVDKFDAAVKSSLKAVVDAAAAAGAAAGNVAIAAEKAGKEKGVSPATVKAAAAVKNACSTGPKDATKFASEISAAVDAARAALEKACEKAKPAPAPASSKPAPAKLSPKAMADGKILSALMRKSIALLRKPKGGAAPVRFMVLFNKANPKDLRLYLGPKPEAGLAKLKTQFPPEVKVTRVKDPKGQVVWEKGALTFLSDILKTGLAKQVQLSIRQQTKVTVKVRIKRSDGAVDEADAKDVSDDELQVSPAEEAEMLAAGKAFKAALDKLAPAIQAALKGPNAAKVKSLEAAIRAAGAAEKYDVASDGIDELESLLEEGDVAESDGKDLEADAAVAGPGDKGVAPAKALAAKLGALRSKIDAAVKVGNATSKQIKDYKDAAEKLLQKEVKENVDKATLFVNKIEQLLSDATKAASTLPVAKLEAARSDWIKSRDTAIKEITNLSKAIVAAFAGETTQKGAVKDAITKLGELQIKLQTGLDNELNLAIKTKDPEKQADLVDRARDSLASLQEFIEKDDLMKNLDNNEVVRSMSVVGPMKKSLQAIEAVLR
jgi:hypothetical protein